MYRKRNQLMGLAVCLIDTLVALFSLMVAGMMRYNTIAKLRSAEDLNALFCFIILLHILFFESI